MITAPVRGALWVHAPSRVVPPQPSEHLQNRRVSGNVSAGSSLKARDRAGARRLGRCLILVEVHAGIDIGFNALRACKQRVTPRRSLPPADYALWPDAADGQSTAPLGLCRWTLAPGGETADAALLAFEIQRIASRPTRSAGGRVGAAGSASMQQRGYVPFAARRTVADRPKLLSPQSDLRASSRRVGQVPGRARSAHTRSRGARGRRDQAGDGGGGQPIRRKPRRMIRRRGAQRT